MDIQDLNSLPLNTVLSEIIGASQADDNENKWKIDSTGQVVQVLGNKWYNWHTQQGGYGAIGLVSNWLKEHPENQSLTDKQLFVKSKGILEKLYEHIASQNLNVNTVMESVENMRKGVMNKFKGPKLD